MAALLDCIAETDQNQTVEDFSILSLCPDAASH